MIKLKINNKKYQIPPVSELTVKEYMKILVRGEATSLPEYLSLFTDIPLDKMMNSQIDCASLTALHQRVFNINPDETIKDKKNVFDTQREEDRYLLMSDLSMPTFGEIYHYEVCKASDKLHPLELCVYALAIATMEKDEDIDDSYQRLINRRWVSVLPQAFFLAKKYSKGRIASIVLSLTCIWELKRIKWRIHNSKKNLKRSELL